MAHEDETMPPADAGPVELGLGADATYQACDFGVLTGRYMRKPFGVLMRLPSGGYAAYRSPMGGQPRFACLAGAHDLAIALNKISAPNVL